MKKGKFGVVLAALAILSTSCATPIRNVVEPGTVLVRIKVRGKDAGLKNAEVVESGEVWHNRWDDRVYIYDVLEKSYVWTANQNEQSPTDQSMQFNTKEGSVVGVDVGIRYKITDARKLAATYNEEDEKIVSGPLRIATRDALTREGAKMTIGEVLGARKADLLGSIKDVLNEEFNRKGLEIVGVSFVGAPRIPEAVQTSINNRLLADTARDKARAEKEQAIAELEVAKIRSQQRVEDSKGITADFLKRQELNNNAAAIKKWDGQLPQYSGGDLPFILPTSQ